MNIHQDKILIIDFGSQLTQLIARRIRHLNVYCEVHPFNVSNQAIKQFNPSGVILSGGPDSVYANDAVGAPQAIYQLGVPILGICYGMQIITQHFGGEVELAASGGEFGSAKLFYAKNDLFDQLIDGNNQHGQDFMQVWMSHGDKVKQLPNGFSKIAQTVDCPIAAIANSELKIYGVQFHPEVTHTTLGLQLFKNFVINICKCKAIWTMPNYAQQTIDEIKQKVGSNQVILALSGGVDSSVAALLIHKAIAKQLICIFVDTGLLRDNEAWQVMQTYQESLDLNIIKIDAKQQTYTALAGVIDPEQKRKIIGKLFIDIFEDEASKLPGVKWLAQGTIYPDVIESAGKLGSKTHSIKSHHNVGGLPDNLKLQLLEPLRELFKDEVRTLGLSLGLASSLVMRHPFPGPGLAVRILGEVKPEYIMMLQKADSIFIDELHKNNYYHKVAQAFAVFIPVKTVGVMGDGRTYDYVIALRAVETSDFMSANVANLPLEFITQVANKIINQVKGINRVVYDVSGKPPATIEWE